jgi:hypothetical protein
LREVREGRQGGIAARFDQSGMTDQGNTLESLSVVAAVMKRPAIVVTLEAVVPDVARHNKGVKGALGKESENFCLLSNSEWLDRQSVGSLFCADRRGGRDSF